MTEWSERKCVQLDETCWYYMSTNNEGFHSTRRYINTIVSVYYRQEFHYQDIVCVHKLWFGVWLWFVDCLRFIVTEEVSFLEKKNTSHWRLQKTVKDLLLGQWFWVVIKRCGSGSVENTMNLLHSKSQRLCGHLSACEGDLGTSMQNHLSSPVTYEERGSERK